MAKVIKTGGHVKGSLNLNSKEVCQYNKRGY